MKETLAIILTLLSLNLFGQDSEIESLINQIAKNEVPENFEYYFLVPQSIEQPRIYDSLQNYQIRELKIVDKDFPMDMVYEQNNETLNWKKYDLKKAKLVSDDYADQTSPPTSKNVRFVKYNIKQSEYDNLIKTKKPHTLIVKKKWFWNKNRIWKNEKFHKELIKAWKIDEEKNKEEKVYFQFSNPIFSKDKKYAKISFFENRRCNGNGFTALYRKDNGIWKKLVEYNQVALVTIVNHSKCGDISISYYE